MLRPKTLRGDSLLAPSVHSNPYQEVSTDKQNTTRFFFTNNKKTTRIGLNPGFKYFRKSKGCNQSLSTNDLDTCRSTSVKKLFSVIFKSIAKGKEINNFGTC